LTNHRFSPRALVLVVSPILAFALVAIVASGAFGHDVQTVSGTVDCQGNYTITVHADVWDPTHLFVTLDGNTIYDQATGSSDHSQRDIILTGTSASAGQAIFAKTGDESNAAGANGTLVGAEQDCSTPIPTPTETPVVTPSETPSPSETPVVTPSETPIATPIPSIPNTAMKDVGTTFPAPIVIFGGLVLIGLTLLLVARAAFGKR
jgi:hypothetical protein